MTSPEVYAKQHQKAFRTAFDFLNSHFPPGTDDEWWIRAAEDVGRVNDDAGGGKLVTGLLQGVYEYLADEYEKRRDKNGKTDD